MIGRDSIFAIRTTEISKKFGEFYAVRNVNLKINRSEVYALVGNNGAGKTTLMKILVGLYAPSSGYSAILGLDIAQNPFETKKMFSYVPDDPSAYDYLTGYEFLSLTGNLRGMRKEKLKKDISKLSEIFPIKDILSQQMSGYSRGNRQKTAFLAALLTQPPVLFIDEPIAGLDPASQEIFGETLRKYAKEGGTVLFISHNLPFVKVYADRVGLMVKGKITHEEKSENIKSLEKFSGLL